MGRKFVVVGGNWIASAFLAEVVVSPPFVFLQWVKFLLLSDFHVAAQNSWVRRAGAFTGEISAEMLVNLGIPWVIRGHSERRLILNESNEFVGDKIAYALYQGLKVIACVGETLHFSSVNQDLQWMWLLHKQRRLQIEYQIGP